MRFYNSNPSGRILNRFSKDMGNIDEYIPSVLIDVIEVQSVQKRRAQHLTSKNECSKLLYYFFENSIMFINIIVPTFVTMSLKQLFVLRSICFY